MWESNGEYYKWTGNLPKTVPAGSTPETTGGIGPGAWLSIGDSLLHSMLASSTGSQLIGTNHRGNMQLDLDAIDRRPDGYGNSIAAVLANGKDVEINKDISQSSQAIMQGDQVYNGVGGRLTITEQTSSGIMADARSSTNKDFVRISSAKLYGSVVDIDASAAAVGAYGVFLRDSEYPVVDGMYASGFTGGIANTNTNTISSVIRNVRVTNSVYHPAPVRGGYGVFLDETRQAIIDGVQFDAASGNNGRHMLYVSRGGGGNS